MDLLRLVLLAAVVGCLLLYVEIPESDDEIKPEYESIWSQFEIENFENCLFHLS